MDRLPPELRRQLVSDKGSPLWEIKRTLGTGDPREVALAQARMAAEVAALFAQARAFLSGATQPVRLSDKEVAALTGEWYRQRLAEWEENPGSPHGWEDVGGSLVDALREASRRERQRLGLPVADDPADDDDDMRVPWFAGRLSGYLAWIEQEAADILATSGRIADEDSRQRLAANLASHALTLFRTTEARARGDYSPDRTLESFPKLAPLDAPEALADGGNPRVVESATFRLPKGREPAPTGSQGGGPKGITFTELVDLWATGRKVRDRTRAEFGLKISRLSQHVGHDDPARVTVDDILAWRDALSGKLHPKTVTNHIVVASAIYAWGIKNRRLSCTNPAKSIEVVDKSKASDRRLSFTDGDTEIILSAARNRTGAFRWLPWLLAFTGARAEEVCQALVSDIQQHDGIWYLDINDEGGKRLKNAKSARKVPLHSALIEEGFMAYLGSVPRGGRLFPDLKQGAYGSWSGEYVKDAGKWLRGLGIADKRKVANHSWRHRFIDQAKAVLIPRDVRMALTGHTSSDVGDQYGSEGYPLPVLASELAKLPVPPGLLPLGQTPVEPSRALAEGPAKPRQGHASKVAKRKLVPGKERGRRKATAASLSPST